MITYEYLHGLFRTPVLSLGFFLGMQSVAQAEFSVCNQSFDVVNIAIGQLHHDKFRTQGWWKIGPNQCASVIQDPLESRYVYVFAKDVFGKGLLNGSVPMCISPNYFVIDGETDCLVRGFLPAKFIEIDTHKTPRWTIFIAAQPN